MGNVPAPAAAKETTEETTEETAAPPPKVYTLAELKECPHVGPDNPSDLLRERERGFEFRRVSRDAKGAVAADDDDASSNGTSTLTRLFHVATGLMVTRENRSDLVPDGKTWDEISGLCQRLAQDRLVEDHSLRRVALETEGEALDRGHGKGPEPPPPIYALVDLTDPLTADSERSDLERPREVRPTLVVIPGMGKSRAGILSVNELLESGLEVGSADFHVAEARARGWEVVLLDPNARGAAGGAAVVAHSLRRLIRREEGEGPVYVLAHSAGGGHLVRYLLDDEDPGSGALRERLVGVAFSDSTHNVQWARRKETTVGVDGTSAFDFLQSSHCLYVRNNRVHSSEFESDDAYRTGEACAPDVFWTHRYGRIPTVWAGTTEHSLVCYVARHVIWNFFNERSAETKGG